MFGKEGLPGGDPLFWFDFEGGGMAFSVREGVSFSDNKGNKKTDSDILRIRFFMRVSLCKVYFFLAAFFNRCIWIE